jgi:hypothetical protein
MIELFIGILFLTIVFLLVKKNNRERKAMLKRYR